METIQASKSAKPPKQNTINKRKHANHQTTKPTNQKPSQTTIIKPINQSNRHMATPSKQNKTTHCNNKQKVQLQTQQTSQSEVESLTIGY